MRANKNQTSNETDEISSKAGKLLHKFVSSVGVLVDDITALEVNTMVVDEITGAKFNARDAYQEIYAISDKDYFNAKNIPQNLINRYKALFAQLEKEYFYLLLDPAEPNFYNPESEKVERYQARLKNLKQKEQNKNSEEITQEKAGGIVETDPKYIELARPILPDPSPVPDGENQKNPNWQQDIEEIQKLLGNDKFLRTLRKVSELKAALDSSDVTSTKIDIIYAQTVMQLDGDIISRYHKELFQEDEDVRNLIIKIHNEGLVAGEQQWRGVLNFLMTLVQGIAHSSFLSRNGRRDNK
ncbi:hypothetical protein [Scytonema sp. NUACC21]